MYIVVRSHVTKHNRDGPLSLVSH